MDDLSGFFIPISFHLRTKLQLQFRKESVKPGVIFLKYLFSSPLTEMRSLGHHKGHAPRLFLDHLRLHRSLLMTIFNESPKLKWWLNSLTVYTWPKY